MEELKFNELAASLFIFNKLDKSQFNITRPKNGDLLHIHYQSTFKKFNVNINYIVKPQSEAYSIIFKDILDKFSSNEKIIFEIKFVNEYNNKNYTFDGVYVGNTKMTDLIAHELLTETHFDSFLDEQIVSINSKITQFNDLKLSNEKSIIEQFIKKNSKEVQSDQISLSKLNNKIILIHQFSDEKFFNLDPKRDCYRYCVERMNVSKFKKFEVSYIIRSDSYSLTPPTHFIEFLNIDKNLKFSIEVKVTQSHIGKSLDFLYQATVDNVLITDTSLIKILFKSLYIEAYLDQCLETIVQISSEKQSLLSQLEQIDKMEIEKSKKGISSLINKVRNNFFTNDDLISS